MTSVSRSEAPRATGPPPAPRPLLAVEDLTIAFPRVGGFVFPANRVAFSVDRGRTLGLVGESGSGKSVTLRSLIGLVPPPGAVVDGRIEWGGRNVLEFSPAEMRALRGLEIAMIFQDPSASLNPVYAVGEQIADVARVRLGMSRKAAWERAIGLLDRVGISSPRQRARDYPHQLSGGMRQRVMIAMVLACGPRLVLADEPTTALDVTIQDQLLTLLIELQAETGMSMVIVSHDLGVIADVCDDVAVMYAGSIVEYGSRDAVIGSPRHPYTQGLLSAVLPIDLSSRGRRARSIEGQPPDLRGLPPGCPFQARCPHVGPGCASIPVELDRRPPTHGSACPFVATSRA
jgi:oligopeptide/dipeptide ABC transporter ATP-binding protein